MDAASHVPGAPQLGRWSRQIRAASADGTPARARAGGDHHFLHPAQCRIATWMRARSPISSAIRTLAPRPPKMRYWLRVAPLARGSTDEVEPSLAPTLDDVAFAPSIPREATDASSPFEALSCPCAHCRPAHGEPPACSGRSTACCRRLRAESWVRRSADPGCRRAAAGGGPAGSRAEPPRRREADEECPRCRCRPAHGCVQRVASRAAQSHGDRHGGEHEVVLEATLVHPEARGSSVLSEPPPPSPRRVPGRRSA